MAKKCGKSEEKKTGMVCRHPLATSGIFLPVSPPKCVLKHFNASKSRVSPRFGPS